jgi:hypothetical protein
MNPLPQRKKTAEEIAKLRDALGATAPQPPLAAPSSPPPGTTPPPPPARPTTVVPQNRQTRQPDRTAEPAPRERKAIQPRIVRSLKKSEQGPVWVAPPSAASAPADSKIPLHRHSDQDIQEIRRREFLEQVVPPVPAHAVRAHWSLLLIGYAFAVGGPICSFFGMTVHLPGALAITALLISIFIFVTKPYSRPHAGFIGALAIFVIIFGALYYFPQLRNAA